MTPVPWVILNVATAVMVATVLAYMLARYSDDISRAERLGLGMAGAGMLLRIGPIIARNILAENSPFDDWSVTFLHVGMAVYVIGWLWRKESHEWLRARAARGVR
jgi:hypothetical protein